MDAENQTFARTNTNYDVWHFVSTLLFLSFSFLSFLSTSLSFFSLLNYYIRYIMKILLIFLGYRLWCPQRVQYFRKIGK